MKNCRRWYSPIPPLVLLLLFTIACTPIIENGAHGRSQPTFVTEKLLIDQPGYAYQWSPKGQQLLLVGPEPPARFAYQSVDRPLAIHDLSTGRTTTFPKPGYAPLWAPDGRALLFSSGQILDGTYHLWLYTVATGEVVEVAPLPALPQWWLASGKLVYETATGLWFTTLALPVTVDPALGTVRLPPHSCLSSQYRWQQSPATDTKSVGQSSLVALVA